VQQPDSIHAGVVGGIDHKFNDGSLQFIFLQQNFPELRSEPIESKNSW
jgi:hypothetical protein